MPVSSTSESVLALRFGQDVTWEIPNDRRIASFLEPAISPVEDLEAAIDQALSQPIEFPSLDQTVVPGDSLVFAVDPTLPGLTEVVPRVLNWFARCGTAPENMTVVMAGSQTPMSGRLSETIRDRLGTQVEVEFHDPDDRDQIAYVAANADADPIYMNRTLVDADVVIPMTVCRPTTSLDYLGAYGIYPLLSDRSTRGAFYRLAKLDDPQSHDRLTAWADQAARWAGFMVEIQVLPASGDRVGAVLAGLTEPLERETRRQMDAAWKTPAPMADLTIALLDGEAHQSWLGIARALHAANLCTHHGGAIVICTQTREALGKSLGRLRGFQTPSSSLADQLARDDSDDAIAASLVYHATRDKHVYLVSKMKCELVESLGLGVLEQPSELQHLMDQFPSTLVLGSAQHRQLELSEP